MFLKYNYCDFPHEDFKKFLTNNKINQIVCNNQSVELFQNYEIDVINIDEKISLQMQHLIESSNYLQQQVKYFSLSDILKNTLFNDIENNYCFFVKKYISPRSVAVSLPIKHTFSVQLNGQNIASPQEKPSIPCSNNPIPYVNFEEFFFLLKTKAFNNFSLILGAKILSSGFFFSEFVDMFGYNHSININFNMYFNNFNHCKNFMASIGYSDFFTTFEQQNNFKDAILYLKNKLHIKSYDPIHQVVLCYDNNFCLNGKLYAKKESMNCENYSCDTLKFKTSLPKKRYLEIPLENSTKLFDNAYDFYMNDILGFKRKSVSSLILKHLYNCFFTKETINSSLIFHKEAVEKFLNTIAKQTEVDGNIILHKKRHLFFSLSNYQTKRLKIFAKNKNIFHIFIANFKNYTIEEYRLRKSKIPNLLKVVY